MSYFRTPAAIARKSARGLTLLELATVLVIIGILAGLTLNGIDGLKQRAQFGQQAGDLGGALEGTRADAFGKGAATVFVVDTIGSRYWGIRAPSADPATFLNSFDPASPGDVVFSGSLGAGVTFGPSGGYGASLPAPFVSVPTMTTSSPVAANFGYCSFCRPSGTNPRFGLVLFEPSGQVRFNAEAPTAVGQQFTVTGTSGSVTRIQTFVISAASGAITHYEQ